MDETFERMIDMDKKQFEILSIITDVWRRNPSLRFCQLIGNCFVERGEGDLYHKTDDDLAQRLKATYGE